jgi:hypothetical protein
MKSPKLLSLSFFLVVLATTMTVAQGPGTRIPKPPRCEANASQVYYVDSGQMVAEVHPGPNGGNGYQLNILGTGVDKLEVVKEPYMTSLAIIGQYTTPTSTKWSMTFAPRMGQLLRTIRLRNMCQKGNVFTNDLTVQVRLLDQ